MAYCKSSSDLPAVFLSTNLSIFGSMPVVRPWFSGFTDGPLSEILTEAVERDLAFSVFLNADGLVVGELEAVVVPPVGADPCP